MLHRLAALIAALACIATVVLFVQVNLRSALGTLAAMLFVFLIPLLWCSYTSTLTVQEYAVAIMGFGSWALMATLSCSIVIGAFLVGAQYFRPQSLLQALSAFFLILSYQFARAKGPLGWLPPLQGGIALAIMAIYPAFLS